MMQAGYRDTRMFSLPVGEWDVPAPAAPYSPPRMKKERSSPLRRCRWPSSPHLRQRAPMPALSQRGCALRLAAGPSPDACSARGLCPLCPQGGLSRRAGSAAPHGSRLFTARLFSHKPLRKRNSYIDTCREMDSCVNQLLLKFH